MKPRRDWPWKHADWYLRFMIAKRALQGRSVAYRIVVDGDAGTYPELGQGALISCHITGNLGNACVSFAERQRVLESDLANGRAMRDPETNSIWDTSRMFGE